MKMFHMLTWTGWSRKNRGHSVWCGDTQYTSFVDILYICGYRLYCVAAPIQCCLKDVLFGVLENLGPL